MRKKIRNRLNMILAVLLIIVMADSLLPGTVATAKVQENNKKRLQTFVYKNGDSVIKSVKISMKAKGNIRKKSDIRNIMGYDIICSDVVGLVGEPFSINTDSKFNKAVISFKIDRSKLGNTKLEDLLFLWYYEEEYWFVEMKTKYNKKKSTVSVETTQLGKFMIVDKYEWFGAW